jgi:hypothetical protein
MATLPVPQPRSVAGAGASERLRGPLTLAVVALIVVSALVARYPGLNPNSLWYDDLAWAVFARLGNPRSILFGVANAPPGFLAVLWASSAIFHDPEWSMQLFPFFCGLASIPVMAGVAWRLTKSHGLSLLAAALTALNPLLAHYTVFVKAYSVDFLVTAVLLYVAIPLLVEDKIRPASAVRLLLVASLGVLVSVTSIFVSLPAINAVALRALTRRDQESRALLVGPALLFDAVLVLGAAWFRFSHYGGLHAGYDLEVDFLGRLAHPSRLWRFARHRMLDHVALGLPSWTETVIWDPVQVKWTLAFAGIGMGWAVFRSRTRAVGLLMLTILAGFLLAAYTDLYPITTVRRSIFSFPVVITLAVISLEAGTAWSSHRRAVQLVVGLAVAAFALYAPIRVAYWDVNDARLVTRLSTALTPSDDLILSPAATYLTAYYGPWRVSVPSNSGTDARGVSIVRSDTLQLPPGHQERFVALQTFLRSPLPDRVCYVAFRTGPDEDEDVLAALSDRGYATEVVETTTQGKLYLGHR